jgi:DNA ligase-associated metallophosphoesterase
VRIRIREQHFSLLPQKAMLWEEHKCLIISDLHLGKSSHFRQNGIPVSGELHRQDLMKLYDLILSEKCERLIINGDLVHDSYNHEWEDFKALMTQLSPLRIDLISGNHDKFIGKILAGIQVHPKELLEGPFRFTHEPLSGGAKFSDNSYFSIYGHLHPAVSLNGKGRQRLKLPCFLMKENEMFMPAFSDFTGLNPILPQKGDQVFAVVGEIVCEVGS